MTAPTGTRKPQDRKPKAADQLEEILSEDELLADLPELTPPGKLRVRQRNVIMKLALRLRGFIGDDGDDGDDGEDGTFELAEDDPRLPVLLDILADIDEFAESIAKDQVAYVAWAEGKDYEVFTALLSRYSSAVGESTAS